MRSLNEYLEMTLSNIIRLSHLYSEDIKSDYSDIVKCAHV